MCFGNFGHVTLTWYWSEFATPRLIRLTFPSPPTISFIKKLQTFQAFCFSKNNLQPLVKWIEPVLVFFGFFVYNFKVFSLFSFSLNKGCHFWISYRGPFHFFLLFFKMSFVNIINFSYCFCIYFESFKILQPFTS